MRIITAALAGFAALITTTHAQETPGEALDALYAVISGPVGEARDWDRFRELFVEGAQMSVAVTGADGAERVVVLTLDDYIERNGERLAEIGFTETRAAKLSSMAAWPRFCRPMRRSAPIPASRLRWASTA
jgi:hypothetical protein